MVRRFRAGVRGTGNGLKGPGLKAAFIAGIQEAEAPCSFRPPYGVHLRWGKRSWEACDSVLLPTHSAGHSTDQDLSVGNPVEQMDGRPFFLVMFESQVSESRPGTLRMGESGSYAALLTGISLTPISVTPACAAGWILSWGSATRNTSSMRLA